MGTAPNSTMITTPGVTNAHPVKCSDDSIRRSTPGRPGCGRPRPGRPRWEACAADAATRFCQGRVDLRGGTGAGRVRLALSEQHGDDHVAEDGRDLGVHGDLRPSLLD